MRTLGLCLLFLVVLLPMGGSVGASEPPVATPLVSLDAAPPEALDLSHFINCGIRPTTQCICERACTRIYERCLSGINPLQCGIDFGNCLDNCPSSE
jgi:hypothetical protein